VLSLFDLIKVIKLNLIILIKGCDKLFPDRGRKTKRTKRTKKQVKKRKGAEEEEKNSKNFEPKGVEEDSD